MKEKIVGFEFLRFIFACLIVLLHAGSIMTGYLAVDCFFVLSGFLLALSFFKKTNTDICSYISK